MLRNVNDLVVRTDENARRSVLLDQLLMKRAVSDRFARLMAVPRAFQQLRPQSRKTGTRTSGDAVFRLR